MFAGLLSSKLVFLDAIGSDPTKPRKIPGATGRACVCHSLARVPLPGPGSNTWHGQRYLAASRRCEGLAARGVVRTVPAAAAPCATAAQRETFRRAARVLPLRFHPNSARSSRPPARVCRALLHAHGLQPFQVGLHPAGNDGRKRVYAA